MSNLFIIPPPRDLTWSLAQVYKHKFKAGDIVAYILRTNRAGRNYQFSLVEVIAPVYDRLRVPRYQIKILKRLSVKNGTNQRKYSKASSPLAYHLDRNHFPPDEWDEQIRRKQNLTRVLNGKLEL